MKTILAIRKPVFAKEISKEIGFKPRSVNMHLHGLRKAGHLMKSEEGYVVTEEGKKAIGFPKINIGIAQKILRTTSLEGAFYFYTGIDHPSGVYSNCLSDFCERIRSTDIESIMFHLTRGDFESWIRYLGDNELGKRVELIQEAGLIGESLRDKLYKTIKARYGELAAIGSR